MFCLIGTRSHEQNEKVGPIFHTSCTMQEHYQRLSGDIFAATCHNTTVMNCSPAQLLPSAHPHSVVALK